MTMRLIYISSHKVGLDQDKHHHHGTIAVKVIFGVIYLIATTIYTQIVIIVT